MFAGVREHGDVTAQGTVGGGDAHGVGVRRPVLLQLSDLAQWCGDALALVGDPGMGGFEGVLGVRRAFAPGSLDRSAPGFVGVDPEAASTGCGVGDPLVPKNDPGPPSDTSEGGPGPATS
ncbi:hypothetical protein [Streptomyces sp. WG7]|uniref:hypothetical protein n=1 Tax=Streptomyces sp. WG7 TaxID=3417650 RepID=UPI003CF1723B